MKSQTTRFDRTMNRIKRSTAKSKAKQKRFEQKTKTAKAKMNKNLYSTNPLRRKIAEGQQLAKKKQDVRLRKLESEAKLAELDPKLQADKSKTENEIKIEKAKYRNKTASATALAGGMASLGKGLSDENNQDDDARRRSQEEIVKTIFADDTQPSESSETGLTQGVM